MALTLITSPTVEPVTVAEVRRQLLLNTSAGEPVPSAPTVALASPAIAGSVTAGAHRYRVTFVTADGETDGGDISAIVTVADAATNGKVELTSIAVGGTNVTSRKLYRTAAGGSTYLLLATLSNNTATVYTDNIADGSLGAEVPTTNTTADPELTAWITAARDRAELATQRSLLTQTWDLVLDDFPADTYIEIPKPPLVSVTHLKYKDTAGTLQTWAASNYVVDAPAGPRCRRGRLSLARSVVWPSTYGQAGDVTVRFICGNATAAAVPELLKSAIKIDVSALYANREGETPLPDMVAAVYRSFKSHARQRVGL